MYSGRVPGFDPEKTQTRSKPGVTGPSCSGARHTGRGTAQVSQGCGPNTLPDTTPDPALGLTPHDRHAHRRQRRAKGEQPTGQVGVRRPVVQRHLLTGGDDDHQVWCHSPGTLRTSGLPIWEVRDLYLHRCPDLVHMEADGAVRLGDVGPVSYTHLRA